MNSGSLFNGIYYSIKSISLWAAGYSTVISKKFIHGLRKYVPLVLHCCTLTGISTMTFSSMKTTLRKNYAEWNATCIVNNSAAAVSILKQDYKEGEMTMKSALALAVKVINKTMDVSNALLKKWNLPH